MSISTNALQDRAISLGFNMLGLTPARPSPTLSAYLHWIDQEMHGRMGYLARPDRIARRKDLNEILPGVQSLLIVGMDYGSDAIPQDVLEDPSRGRIAAYAWGLDYHDIMQARLTTLTEWISAEAAGTVDSKIYVDTGAILERSHAQQAGMGFIGKNTMLIHPRRGGSFFLGVILTTLEFDSYDEPHRETMCGTCTRCLNACPTDAFPAPHILDARRCISYHTIENKGFIDMDLRASFGNWIFGCDICQDVCPFQRFAPTTAISDFLPIDVNRAAPHLLDLLLLDEDTFRKRYQGTPLYRIKRERLVRNACIAAGNWKNPQAIPMLIQLLYDNSPLIRGHAAWSLWQIMQEDASKLLTDLYDRDETAEVRAEVAALLD